MLIIPEDLNKLSDKQIIILDAIIKYRRYSDIVSKYSITKDNLSTIVTEICTILKVWPRTPMTLRAVYKTSLKHNKMELEIQKQAGLAIVKQDPHEVL
jgi:hypothetical protein